MARCFVKFNTLNYIEKLLLAMSCLSHGKMIANFLIENNHE
jgi:hypothetical protein